MQNSYEAGVFAANAITDRLSGRIPDTAVVLGSGLGVLTEQVWDAIRIPYAQIPNFPCTTVASHKGELVCGKLGEKSVLLLSGRFHHYEGFDFSQVVFPVRVLHLLLIDNI